MKNRKRLSKLLLISFGSPMLMQLFTIAAPAQNHPEFAVTFIPENLKSDANAVTRYENNYLDVSEKGSALLKISKAVTVLNSHGDDQLLFNDYEDAFRKLETVRIRVYNADGVFKEEYNKKQLEKERLNDGFSLINDGKVYYMKIAAAQYPVTVVFETEVKLNGFLDFEDINVRRFNEAVQFLSYTIKTTPKNPVLFKNFQCSFTPTVNAVAGSVVYNWEIHYQPAVHREKNSNLKTSLPHIAITPTFFEMDGYKGSYASWQTYGNWYFDLCKGTHDIGNTAKETIRSLVEKTADQKEKIKILYRYLQKNFRYVSIQLGIGGFKPFEASFVNKNKYGDCKALSNYMQAMLELAGINSYQALVNAGYNQEPADPGFPNHLFNHVILCVPNNGDTVWLECTSSYAAFGSLGPFTENRNALLVTPQGGILVATPKSKASDNILSTKNLVYIQNDFSATAELQVQHSGAFYYQFIHGLLGMDPETQKSYLINELGYKPFEKMMADTGTANGISGTRIRTSYNKMYDFNAGLKYFISPHLFSVWQLGLPATPVRTSDFYFDFPFQENDTTVFFLPAGFVIDNLPEPVQLHCTNAVFHSGNFYDAKENTVLAITGLEIKQPCIKARLYEETRLFFDQVLGSCNQKIVIRKQSSKP